MTNEPEVIPDADHERLIERVAAIDVAKEFGKVCVRLPDPARPGRRISHSSRTRPGRSPRPLW